LKKATFLITLALLAGACENVDKNLWDQKYAKIEKVKSIPPPEGSIPVLGTKVKIDYNTVDIKNIQPPYPLDSIAAERGKKLFDVYCSPCHGFNGEADTIIAKKMDFNPPPLTSDRVKNEFKDADIFVKMLASDALMPKYRTELDDNEAWDVVAYVRQLQKTKK
jgi:mono/diheme cytochrome c family protein